MPTNPNPLELDPRFPSGEWTGFHHRSASKDRVPMTLSLTFRAGIVTGEGSDADGDFSLRGRYSAATGEASFTKLYSGRHALSFRGFNEGKGIWGTWTRDTRENPDKGGFHIWPKSMPNPSRRT